MEQNWTYREKTDSAGIWKKVEKKNEPKLAPLISDKNAYDKYNHTHSKTIARIREELLVALRHMEKYEQQTIFKPSLRAATAKQQGLFLRKTSRTDTPFWKQCCLIRQDP